MKVKCAAILYEGKIYEGVAHCDIGWDMLKRKVCNRPYPGGDAQGFVTECSKFVSREEALSEYYLLTDSKQCIPCDDTLVWAHDWSKNKVVKQDKIRRFDILRYLGFPGRKPVLVSTVFLGINHNWGRDRDSHPILFETMVFGGKHNDLCQRYETYNEGEKNCRTF